MNKKDLKIIFKKISNNHFIQINDSSNNVLKIGKYDNKYAFVVRGKTNRLRFKSSGFVSLLLSFLNESEKQLIFILEKDSLLDVFVKLIEDIRDSFVTEDVQNKLDLAYNRWLLWKELFSNGNIDLLSESKIQGLLGELLFLDQVMFKFYSSSEAILSWGGANYNKKDFEFAQMWFEIKTTLNCNNRIKISSLEQLNSNSVGYLVITDLEKSTLDYKCSTNLNNLVKDILKKISVPELVDVFINKLTNQGYTFNKLYSKYNYILVSRKFYLVNNDFPKLTFNNIPYGIIEAQYTVDTLFLDKFNIDEREVFQVCEEKI